MSVTTHKPLNWAGDTIVEVLIVVVVIGVVISGGYNIAVASLQSTQLVQERGFALKLAETQLESLKAANIKDPNFLTNAITLGSGFCVDSNLGYKQIAGGSPTADIAVDIYSNYTAPSVNCFQDANNSPSCGSFCYYYGIKPLGSNNFLATVRWDSSRGNKQQVQLAYKVYE